MSVPRDELPETYGVRCRKCGCADMRVIETRWVNRGVLRKRSCRHCGNVEPTYERAAFARATPTNGER